MCSGGMLAHLGRDDVQIRTIPLADPKRLRIVRSLFAKDECMSCTEAAPCPDMAKSTLSNHLRILREAGLVRTSKQGVEHRNVLREDDINARFPKLLKTILSLPD